MRKYTLQIFKSWSYQDLGTDWIVWVKRTRYQGAARPLKGAMTVQGTQVWTLCARCLKSKPDAVNVGKFLNLSGVCSSSVK